jgi:hypothetical protein
VQHGVVENDIAMGRRLNLQTDMFPNQARCEPLVPQVAIDRVVAHFLSRMVRVVRDLLVNLANQQVLVVIQSGRRFDVMPVNVSSSNPFWVYLFFKFTKYFSVIPNLFSYLKILGWHY